MTKEEKVEAYAMCLDGYTYQSIADKFGVSKQYIGQIMPPECGRGARSFLAHNYFPNLARWLSDNRCSMRALADKIGFNYNTVLNWLSGKSEPSLYAVKQVLKVTGMTFEEAFMCKGDEHVSD